MKYIKEYDPQRNMEEVEKLEDLGDCLQEVFDKHGISAKSYKEFSIGDPESDGKDMTWSIKRVNYNPYPAKLEQSIDIKCSSISKYREVYDDIIKIKDMIQKRIHHKISCNIFTFSGERPWDLEGSRYDPPGYNKIKFIRVKLI